MLDFSLVSPHLQVKIAEKMGFFDQREFELSSKCGKHIVSFTNYKPVFDVFELGMNETDFCFQIELPGKEDRVRKTWNIIRQTEGLPRFKVGALVIREEVPHESLHLLLEQCKFIENEAELKIVGRNPDMEIFRKLIETFKITKLQLNGHPNPELVRLSWFSELDEITTIIIDDVPDSVLINLKASTLILNEKTGPSRLCSLSNSYFQQWIRKTRSIEHLYIYTEKDGQTSNTDMDEKTLMADISFSKISAGVVTATIIAKNGSESRRNFKMGKERYVAYMIDTGDRTLLICASEFRTFNVLNAQEVIDVVIEC